MGLHAIITAGGGVPRSLRALTTVERKALIKVGGQTMLQAAVQAAHGCLPIDRIIVVGNEQVAAAKPPGAEYVREGTTLVDNIQRGFEHCGGQLHDYLILSPDLPFVTSDAIRVFVTTAREQCELAAPLVSRDDFLRHFPGAPNRFARLAGGKRATMGSCFYFAGPALKANIPLGRDFYRYRRSPHRLAVLMGLPIVLAYVLGRLSPEMLARRAEQLTGAVCRAIPMQDASIAFDVDGRENLEYAQRLLETRTTG